MKKRKNTGEYPGISLTYIVLMILSVLNIEMYYYHKNKNIIFCTMYNYSCI